MKAYRHLIVAIDFTPSCRNALREAVRISSETKATVTAVHVMDEFLVHELKRALSTDENTVREDWRNRLRKFVDDSELGTWNIGVEVRIGHPFVKLADSCQMHGADLLVMGAKGSRDEPHRVGAIAAKCVRRAPADVLLVRGDAQGPFKRIVACVDFSENSAKATRHAFQTATLDRAAVDCLHVYQSALAMSLDYGGLVAPMPMVTDPATMAQWEADLEKFMAPFRAECPDVPASHHIIERVNIREAILDHVMQTKADLVVLCTRGKSGLRELLIGTTAEKVVANAPCSILAVKPDGFVTAED